MNSHSSLRFALAFAVLAFALATQPVLATGATQCQAHPLCTAQAGTVAQTAALLPPTSSPAASLPFALQLIGDCCPNNDASQCPAQPGYSKVVCGFPMCASGSLSCIYSN